MNKVFELRTKSNMTQEELAKAIGVERTVITRAENGNLSVKTAKKLATYFSLDWKIFFDNECVLKTRNPGPAA